MGCAMRSLRIQKPAEHGVSCVAAGLHPIGLSERHADHAPRRRPAPRQMAKARRVHRRQRGRRAGLHDLPCPAPGDDPQHQSDRAVDKEVKRHADVVGIFPNKGAIIRLIGAVLLEANPFYSAAWQGFGGGCRVSC